MTGVAGRRGALAVFALSALVPLLFLVAGVAVRDSVPETWDEQFDQDIGRFYLSEWRTQGAAGLERRFIPLQRNYGPGFDVVVVGVHRLLHDRLGWVTGPVASHHMATLAASALGLWLVFWIGAALFRPEVGLLASALLALMPQFVAHSQNNLKDTPLAVAFSAAVLLFVHAVRRDRLWLFACAGVLVGYAYAIKPNGVFVWVVVGLWLVVTEPLRSKRWLRLATGFALSAGAAVVTVLVVWPYYRQTPVARFLETLRTFRTHVYNELVFYLGQHVPAHDVPWHFPYVMLTVTAPLAVLGLLAVSLVLLARAWARRSDDRSPLTLLWLWLLVPPTLQVLSGAAMLDGIRHFLPVLPAMALLAAAGAWRAGQALARRRRALGVAWFGALAVAALLLVRTLVVLHPYQGVFFNALAGGTAGARERFELDYWGVSLAAAADWLNRNAPPGSRVWLPIPAQHFFRIDRSRLHFVSDFSRRPNYKVNLVRGLTRTFDTEDDYLHPRRAPVFSVRAGGADLAQVFEYPEHRDVAPGTTLSPGRYDVDGAVEGVEARTFDTSLTTPTSAPFSLGRLGFDCERNAWADRPVGLRLEGYAIVERAGSYVVEVRSDDDAVVFLEDRPVVTNASQATTRNVVRLAPGAYRLRLDYRNDAGPACLAAAIAPSGAAGPVADVRLVYVPTAAP